MRGACSNAKRPRLSANSTAREYDPAKSLLDPVFVRQAVLESLVEGDLGAVLGIYRAHLRVLNRTRAARALDVSRQYVHRMIRAPNMPSLRTFAAFMRLLGREIEGEALKARPSR